MADLVRIIRDSERELLELTGEDFRDVLGREPWFDDPDPSTQELANLELLRVSRRLHDTLENIADAFYTLDPAWQFTWLNPKAESLLGRTRDELLGKNVWEEFPEARDTVFQRQFEDAVNAQASRHFEEFYPPFGKWLELEVYPSAEGIAVYFRDVTERRANREALLEQANLLDHANDAILVRDLAHKILFWNRAAERLYGWSAAEAKGRSVRELLYTDPKGFLAATDVTLAQGEWVGELEQVTKDRQRRTVECHWTLVRDDQGQPKSILAINTDITQRKKLEAQFLRAQRMESIGALAGGIAHDINNTLAPILMAVELLRRDETDPVRLDDLQTIETSVERGAAMVRQLLSFARGSDGRREKVDLGRTATEFHKIIRDTFPKDITAQLTIDPKLWRVEADTTQMHQLVANLCVNARDAMPNGGLLTVAVENVVLDEVYAGMNLQAQPGPYVLIRIEDTGTGMPPGVLDRIFEPFFTTKAIGQGTGLGLSTAHSIARSHGGFIHVYSEIGKGTRFKVYIPAEANAKAAEALAVEQTQLPRGDGELVLVVDDEEPIRAVSKRTLERYGYRVLLAANGAEAVSVYAQHRDQIDVVLTDMTMPVMDGPATIVALKSMNPQVKIVGSSGLSANGSVAKAMGAGVEHFVPKPYTADAMLRVLQQILRGS